MIGISEFTKTPFKRVIRTVHACQDNYGQVSLEDWPDYGLRGPGKMNGCAHLPACAGAGSTGPAYTPEPSHQS
jgi:hypothetical protein